MSFEILEVPAERLAELFGPISAAFGLTITPEILARPASVPELSLRLAAMDGDRVVGAAGSFLFDLTVPGGAAIEAAGLTLVAVLPTHRRRGVLRAMMRYHLDEAHRRGQAVAVLFASEGAIYGRFGYGMATLAGEIDLERARAGLRAGEAAGTATARLLTEAEAVLAFPPIWDRVRPTIPGMLSRSEAWWRVRRLSDPDWSRAGRGPLQRVLIELDGQPAAYALYRFETPAFSARFLSVTVEVHEAVGVSAEATRSLWRYLFELDLAARFVAKLLPIDHPLHLLLAEPRRLQMRLGDGLWLRLVDVGRALSARGLASGSPVVIELHDTFCPWNSGRYRVAESGTERTIAEPDLTLDAEALASAYLGAFSFTALAQAGRVQERTPAALTRADALFRTDRAPWSPEIF